jgi:hypothetical protein
MSCLLVVRCTPDFSLLATGQLAICFGLSGFPTAFGFFCFSHYIQATI